MAQATASTSSISLIFSVSSRFIQTAITAAAYGIGAYWSTSAFIYTPEMNAFLEIGEKDKCLGIIYLGYPEIEWPKSHRKPIEYLTTWK